MQTLQVDHIINSAIHIQPKTLLYEDIADVDDEGDDSSHEYPAVDHVEISTEERHKFLKHKMKGQILSTLQNQLLFILNNGTFDEVSAKLLILVDLDLRNIDSFLAHQIEWNWTYSCRENNRIEKLARDLARRFGRYWDEAVLDKEAL
jgi:hypothetical protein